MAQAPHKAFNSHSATGRRTPTQQRAQNTIETLFQATAQILECEGEAALTTNKVAATAGFSIGTLYQYFPSKDALIQAMSDRVRHEVMDQLESYLSELERREDFATQEPKALLREAVRMIVRGLTARGKNKGLSRLFWALEQPDQTIGAVKEVTERLALFFERTHHPQFLPPNNTELFVLTRAVLGVVRSASLEKSPLLGSIQLEEGLLKMAWGLFCR